MSSTEPLSSSGIVPSLLTPGTATRTQVAVDLLDEQTGGQGIRAGATVQLREVRSMEVRRAQDVVGDLGELGGLVDLGRVRATGW
ncbi:MAG: hypothetical protein ACRDO2_06340 [Nocardioidaceae bacterium]